MTVAGIEAASNRQEAFLKFYLAVRKLDSIHHNVLDPHYIGNELVYKQTQVDLIYKSAKAIDRTIPAITDIYLIMDPDDVLEITTPIHLYPPESPGSKITLSIDEGYSLIQNIGLRIAEYAMIQDENFYYDQILAFGLNEFLDRSSEIITVFRDHLGERLDLIQEYLKKLVIGESIATFVLIVSYSYISYQNMKLRKGFLESLTKIDEVKYLPKIQKVEKFIVMLQGIQFNTDKKKFYAKMRQARAALDSKKAQRRRNVVYGKLNKNAFVRIFQQIFVYLMIFAISIIITVRVDYFTEQIRKYANSYHMTNLILEKCILSIVALDSYILEPTTDLFSHPIQTEFWKVVEFINKKQNFFLHFEIDKDDEDQIKFIAESNFCIRYHPIYGSLDECQAILDSALRYGMSGMLSKLVTSIEGILVDFNKSDKSEDEVQKIFLMKAYYELSILAITYIDPPFYEVRDYLQLRSDFYKVQNENFVITMNIVYIVLVFLLGFLTKLIFERLIEEKKETFKLLALIPPEVIMESPYISKFL